MGGFLGDFAAGFFQTASDINAQKREFQQQVDLERQKQLMGLDVNTKLLERKSELEAAQKEADFKRLQQGRLDDVAGLFNTTPSAVGNVDVPEVSDVDMEQSWTEAASRAAERGDDDAYKSYKAKADKYKTRREVANEQRTTGRQPTLSLDKANAPEILAKDDSTLMSENEPNVSLYEKYFGIPRPVNYKNPSESDADAIKAVKQSSVAAVKLSSILSELTADETTGVASKSSGEINSDAVNLVKYKNILSNPNLASEHDEVIAQISDILDNYPGAETYIIKEAGLEEVLNDSTAQPATGTLTPEDMAAEPDSPTAPDKGEALLQQARDAISRGAPRDKVIERLKLNGVDPTGL